MPIVDVMGGQGAPEFTITDAVELKVFDLANKVFGFEDSDVKDAFGRIAKDDLKFAEWLGEQIKSSVDAFRSASDIVKYANDQQIEYKVSRGIIPRATTDPNRYTKG